METKSNNLQERQAHLEIKFQIEDLQENKCVLLKFSHTDHSLERSAQRGITPEMIYAVLEYGESFFKQGLVYYVLGADNIPKRFLKEKNRFKNLVVVGAGDSNSIVTCYRAKNPFKLIKHKSKKLLTHRQMAA